MIDFRYHLVSIISIFIALAVGIVLGAGPLDKPIDSTVRQQAADAKKASEQLRTQNDELTGDLKYLDSAVSSLVPGVVGGKLTDAPIVIIALPGTSGSTLKNAREALAAAGAAVSGSVSLTSDWTKSDRADDLDATLSAFAPAGLTLPTGADALGERAAIELAVGVTTQDPLLLAKPDAPGEKLLKGLRDAGFLRVDNQPWVRGSLAVVLGPAPDKPAGNLDSAALTEIARVQNMVLQVPRRVSALTAGTVVAGPRGSADNDGVVSLVRRGELRTSVSTVDDLNTPVGRIALALAVVAEREDETGHYGDGPDSDSALPELAGVTRS